MNIMNEENFDLWNQKKKNIHLIGKAPPYFKQGEIWWAHLGKNISTELAGKGDNYVRPVLILQKVYGNSCIAIPLTSQVRNGNYYCSFRDSKYNLQCAILPQIRYLDGKRLMNKIGKTSQCTLSTLIEKFINILNHK